MPVALPVDWNEVRTLCVAIGVRETARQLGLNENAVKARCLREGWLKQLHDATRTLSTSHRDAEREKAVQTISNGRAPNAPNAVDVMQDYGKSTKLYLAKSANKAAKELQKKTGKELLLEGQSAVQWTKVAATVHGFGGDGAVSLRLELIARGHGANAETAGPVIDAEVSIQRDEDHEDL